MLSVSANIRRATASAAAFELAAAAGRSGVWSGWRGTSPGAIARG